MNSVRNTQLIKPECWVCFQLFDSATSSFVGSISWNEIEHIDKDSSMEYLCWPLGNFPSHIRTSEKEKGHRHYEKIPGLTFLVFGRVWAIASPGLIHLKEKKTKKQKWYDTEDSTNGTFVWLDKGTDIAKQMTMMMMMVSLLVPNHSPKPHWGGRPGRPDRWAVLAFQPPTYRLAFSLSYREIGWGRQHQVSNPWSPKIGSGVLLTQLSAPSNANVSQWYEWTKRETINHPRALGTFNQNYEC